MGYTVNMKQARNTNEKAKGDDMKDVTCLGRVITRTSTQEHFETASRDAGRRAKTLRKLGIQATVSPLGLQVTNLGLVKLTMVTIEHEGRPEDVPSVRISHDL